MTLIPPILLYSGNFSVLFISFVEPYYCSILRLLDHNVSTESQKRLIFHLIFLKIVENAALAWIYFQLSHAVLYSYYLFGVSDWRLQYSRATQDFKYSREPPATMILRRSAALLVPNWSY